MMDVARLAEVSHQTVSRVLNSPDDVRPATRARVLEAIEALGYRRNSAARALVTGRSSSIGIVSFNGDPLRARFEHRRRSRRPRVRPATR